MLVNLKMSLKALSRMQIRQKKDEKYKRIRNKMDNVKISDICSLNQGSQEDKREKIGHTIFKTLSRTNDTQSQSQV